MSTAEGGCATLSLPIPMNALAITGPRSVRRHVDAFLRAAPGSITLLDTPALDAVASHIEKQPPAMIALFGGDGTLNRYLPLLHASAIPVLMFPTGSGNDFAMANGLFTAQDAFRAFANCRNGHANIVSVDLGRVRFGNGNPERLFSCCVNIGLDADAAERTNRLPDWLKQRRGYLLGGAIAVLRYHPQKLSFSGDAVPAISGNGWFVAVSNTPTYGGGLKIAPQASIHDGKLDVTYLQPTSRFTLMRHFPRILSGTHVSLPIIHTFPASHLRVDTEIQMPVYADGEFFGHTPVEISVVPAAIRAVRRSDS